MVMQSSSGEWRPAVTGDFANLSAKTFKELVDKFKEWRQNQPAPTLALSDGWYEITPQMAEQMLIKDARNRKLRLSEITKDARQMAKRNWRKTGQTVVYNDKDGLYDGQHRLWAGYLSGVSFTTFVVTSVDFAQDLFAYYDRGAVRSARDILQTAGYNGNANAIIGAVNLLHRGASVGFDKKGRAVLPQEEILQYVETHTDLPVVASYLLENIKRAPKLLHSNTTAVYLAWSMYLKWGADYQEFMELLCGVAEELPGPIEQLRTVLEKALHARVTLKTLLTTQNQTSLRQLQAAELKERQIIAYTILAFNAWKAQTEVAFKIPVVFPEILAPEQLVQAD